MATKPMSFQGAFRKKFKSPYKNMATKPKGLINAYF